MTKHITQCELCGANTLKLEKNPHGVYLGNCCKNINDYRNLAHDENGGLVLLDEKKSIPAEIMTLSENISDADFFLLFWVENGNNSPDCRSVSYTSGSRTAELCRANIKGIIKQMLYDIEDSIGSCGIEDEFMGLYKEVAEEYFNE